MLQATRKEADPFIQRNPANGKKLNHVLCSPADPYQPMSKVYGNFWESPTPNRGIRPGYEYVPPTTLRSKLYPKQDPHVDDLSATPWIPGTSKWLPVSKNTGSFYATKNLSPNDKALLFDRQPAARPRTAPHRGVTAGAITEPIMGRGDNGAILDHATTTSGTTRDSMAALTALREAEKAAFVAKTNADPAQGYTGHRFARRWNPGEQGLTHAQRIARRRMDSISQRFGASSRTEDLVKAAELPQPELETAVTEYGWQTFPPKGLGGERSGFGGN